MGCFRNDCWTILGSTDTVLCDLEQVFFRQEKQSEESWDPVYRNTDKAKGRSLSKDVEVQE